MATDTIVTAEGTHSCGKYLESRRKVTEGQDYLYVTWIRGFVAGHNWLKPNKQVTRPLEASTIVAYVDKYCRDNPLDGVFNAAEALVLEMGGAR